MYIQVYIAIIDTLTPPTTHTHTRPATGRGRLPLPSRAAGHEREAQAEVHGGHRQAENPAPQPGQEEQGPGDAAAEELSESLACSGKG